METKSILNLLHTFWESEIIADSLYDFLAARQMNNDLKHSIIEIGKMEHGHANVWSKIAKDIHGVAFQASVYLKFKMSLMKVFSFILPLTIFIHYMEHHERNAILGYSQLLGTYKDDENTRKIITNILKEEIGHQWQMMERIAGKGSYIIRAQEAMPGMATGIIETLGLVIGLLAAHSTTLIIGLTGLIAMIGGTIATMSISYISSRGHHDLHEGRTKELSIKREINPTVLRRELESAFIEKGISHETTRVMLDIIGDDAVVLSNLLRAIRLTTEVLEPKETVKTASTFFII